MVIYMDQFSSEFNVGNGYDNSGIINAAIWWIYTQGGTVSSGGTGTLIFPSGEIQFRDNIFIYSGIDLQGSGLQATTLHGINAGLVANCSGGTRIEDYLGDYTKNFEVDAEPYEPGYYSAGGYYMNPEDNFSGISRNIFDVTFRGFYQKRSGSIPGPAFLSYSYNGNAATRFTFREWGIFENVYSDGQPASNSSGEYERSIPARGIDIHGGWSWRFFNPYIRLCWGQGVRIRNGDETNSISPANDMSFFGGEIQGCDKAMELTNVNRFNYQGGTIQGNGIGVTIDGDCRAVSFDSHWCEFNNANSYAGSGTPGAWAHEKKQEWGRVQTPYFDDRLNNDDLTYHFAIGCMEDTPFSVDNSNRPPETVNIANTRCTSGNDALVGFMNHSIVVGRCGKLNNSYNWYSQGKAAGGLRLKNVSFNNNTSYPIKLLNTNSPYEDYDVYGWYENCSSRPRPENPYPDDICNFEQEYFGPYFSVIPAKITSDNPNQYKVPEYGDVPLDREPISKQEAFVRFDKDIDQRRKWEAFRERVETACYQAWTLESPYNSSNIDPDVEGHIPLPPGGQIYIALGDKTYIDMAMGYAAPALGSEYTRDTVSTIRSVSKEFTAVGLLGMIDDGYIGSINDLVSDYVDWSNKGGPLGDDGQPIGHAFHNSMTLKHLMQHRTAIVAMASGTRSVVEQTIDFTEVEDFYRYIHDSMFNANGTPAFYEAFPEGPLTVPTVNAHYDDLNFMLLAEIMDSALAAASYTSSEPLDSLTCSKYGNLHTDYIMEKFCIPLGMTKTHPAPYGPEHWDTIVKYKNFLQFNTNWKIAQPMGAGPPVDNDFVANIRTASAGAPYISSCAGYGTGNWHTTAGDLAKWQGTQTSGGYKSILSEARLLEMKVEVVDNYGWPAKANNFNPPAVQGGYRSAFPTEFGLGQGWDRTRDTGANLRITKDVGLFRGLGCYKLANPDVGLTAIAIVNTTTTNIVDYPVFGELDQGHIGFLLNYIVEDLLDTFYESIVYDEYLTLRMEEDEAAQTFVSWTTENTNTIYNEDLDLIMAEGTLSTDYLEWVTRPPYEATLSLEMQEGVAAAAYLSWTTPSSSTLYEESLSFSTDIVGNYLEWVSRPPYSATLGLEMQEGDTTDPFITWITRPPYEPTLSLAAEIEKTYTPTVTTPIGTVGNYTAATALAGLPSAPDYYAPTPAEEPTEGGAVSLTAYDINNLTDWNTHFVSGASNLQLTVKSGADLSGAVVNVNNIHNIDIILEDGAVIGSPSSIFTIDSSQPVAPSHHIRIRSVTPRGGSIYGLAIGAGGVGVDDFIMDGVNSLSVNGSVDNVLYGHRHTILNSYIESRYWVIITFASSTRHTDDLIIANCHIRDTNDYATNTGQEIGGLIRICGAQRLVIRHCLLDNEWSNIVATKHTVRIHSNTTRASEDNYVGNNLIGVTGNQFTSPNSGGNSEPMRRGYFINNTLYSRYFYAPLTYWQVPTEANIPESLTVLNNDLITSNASLTWDSPADNNDGNQPVGTGTAPDGTVYNIVRDSSNTVTPIGSDSQLQSDWETARAAWTYRNED